MWHDDSRYEPFDDDPEVDFDYEPDFDDPEYASACYDNQSIDDYIERKYREMENKYFYGDDE